MSLLGKVVAGGLVWLGANVAAKIIFNTKDNFENNGTIGSKIKQSVTDAVVVSTLGVISHPVGYLTLIPRELKKAYDAKFNTDNK